ncbi:MAG: hypothetical protein RIQ53_989 [Pseudomonadota bacterium]
MDAGGAEVTRRLGGWAVRGLPLAFLLLMLGVPAAALLAQAGTLDPLALWQDAHLRARLAWSLAQAGLTCALTLALGLPLAWVLARLEFPLRRTCLRLVMLPFVVPTLVAALGVLALLGPHGSVSGALGLDLEGSPALLLYGNVFFNLCLVVRAGVDGLQRSSASRVAAARSLGATPWRAFWRVEWPALQPWLASALCLVFLYCFSGFGLALVLGGEAWATVDVEIYRLVAYELALDEAGSLALWTLGCTALVALAYAAIEQHLARPLGADRLPRRAPQGTAQWLAVAGAVAVIALVAVAPLAALAWRALAAGPAAWAVLLEPEVHAAIGRTLGFSAVAVLAALVLGTLQGLGAQRSVLLRASAFLPLVVSPVIVAFGLLLAWPEAAAGLPLLLATYTLLAMPFVAKAVAAGLDALPASQAQAARTLGASPWRVFWRVTWPQLRPALRRGAGFAAATALGEFAATLFLSRPEWATLTPLIYERLGRPGQANLDAALVLALLLMGLSALALSLIDTPAPADPDTETGTATAPLTRPHRSPRDA